MTSRREFLRASAACVAGSMIPAHAQSGHRPNIVLILLDDMGYSDIGCFGAEIATPNLDRLAAEGVRFRQFHNTARCCPSRAALLTGLYAHQVGVGHMDADWHQPGYRGFPRTDCPTIAEALREVGYRTIMSGKWHLGTGAGHNPWERGFDRFYGIPEGGGVYFWPTRLKRTVVRYVKGQDTAPRVTKPGETFYSTDAFTDFGIEQVRAAAADGTPFFMYLPYVAPHFPQQAWEADVQKYLGRYREGWEKAREARYRRQIELGIIDQKYELSPADGPDWASLSKDQQLALGRQMAVYAAQMDRLDQNVGRLLDSLRETGLEDDTLVIFLSDNGGQRNAEFGFEQSPEALFGSRESYGGYAKGWANLSNTPFRRYKSEEHQGGNMTPLLARWPNRITPREAVVDQVGHIIDLMPTCLAAAGLDPTVAHAGEHQSTCAGLDLLPWMTADRATQPRTLCWEHEGNRAVRAGDWKLVALRKQPWELYDLAADATELHDLAADQPERVAGLNAVYQAWAERCNVLPWPVGRG